MAANDSNSEQASPGHMGLAGASGCLSSGGRDPEWRKRQSEGVKRAWAEGKYKGKPRPDYTKIAAKNRGKKRPAEAVEATRKGLVAKHARGEYDTPARKAHLDKLHAANTGASPEQMDAIRAQRDLDALRPKWRETMNANRAEWEASGKMDDIRQAASARLRGGHGFGKNVEGSLEHSHAKFWRVRSPFGEVFEFVNCYEWVRQNLHRFHDDRPESRMPFWRRVASGLKNIQHPRHPNAPTHYKGWTVVGSWEKGDLLGRDECQKVPATDARALAEKLYTKFRDRGQLEGAGPQTGNINADQPTGD